MNKDKVGAASRLHLAQTDFRAMRGMLDVGAFAEPIFGFHAQQVVEKVLKAWLDALGLNVQRTHDLTELLRALRYAGVDIAPASR